MLLEKTAQDCYDRVTDAQFSWDTIASQFGGIFEDVMNGVGHEVAPEGQQIVKEEKKKRKSRKERERKEVCSLK